MNPASTPLPIGAYDEHRQIDLSQGLLGDSTKVVSHGLDLTATAAAIVQRFGQIDPSQDWEANMRAVVAETPPDQLPAVLIRLADLSRADLVLETK